MKGQDKEGDHLLKCPKIDEIPKLLRQFHDLSGHDGIIMLHFIVFRVNITGKESQNLLRNM